MPSYECVLSSHGLPTKGYGATIPSGTLTDVTLFRICCQVFFFGQISANGKTTSLGDHDTEEQAARAFDRATINKNGTAAKTNFSLQDYKDEIADLRGNCFFSRSE